MPRSIIEKAVQSLYISDAYSDLVVECGSHKIKLHKAVVCPQSAFFRTAVKENAFKEGATGIIKLDHDAPDAVSAMKEFLYTGSYSAPAAPSWMDNISHVEPEKVPAVYEQAEQDASHQWVVEQPETEPDGEDILAPEPEREEPEPEEEAAEEAFEEQAITDTNHEMLFHLDVYALADRIRSPHLKSFAESKFAEAAKEHWWVLEFPLAVKKVYKVSPPGYNGENLRAIVVSVAANHLQELFERNAEFAEMMDEVSGFGADLSKALIRRHETVGNEDRMFDFCCNACHFVGTVPSQMTLRMCPKCGNSSSYLQKPETQGKRKRLSCKRSGCYFVFETMQWVDVASWYCPGCKRHQNASAWETV